MSKVRQLSAFVVLTMALTALSGCGQKGPLVLPEEKPADNNAKPTQNTP